MYITILVKFGNLILNNGKKNNIQNFNSKFIFGISYCNKYIWSYSSFSTSIDSIRWLHMRGPASIRMNAKAPLEITFVLNIVQYITILELFLFCFSAVMVSKCRYFSFKATFLINILNLPLLFPWRWKYVCVGKQKVKVEFWINTSWQA